MILVPKMGLLDSAQRDWKKQVWVFQSTSLRHSHVDPSVIGAALRWFEGLLRKITTSRSMSNRSHCINWQFSRAMSNYQRDPEGILIVLWYFKVPQTVLVSGWNCVRGTTPFGHRNGQIGSMNLCQSQKVEVLTRAVKRFLRVNELGLSGVLKF